MIKISLTDFSDYILKAGAKKQTKVRQIVNRDAYTPQMDFYKKLRDSIVGLHKTARPKKELHKIMDDVTDPKKRGRYPELIEKYVRFLGRKKAIWFAPPRGSWNHEELTVRLNPELGLFFNDRHHVIKIHFSQAEITKNEADIILTLMKRLDSKMPDNTVFCILDVKKRKLYYSDKIKGDLNPVLEGEALSFISIWNRYKKAA